jgi:hypothetical protein
MEHHWGGNRPVEIGLLLLSLTYLSARFGDQESIARRSLVWIGGFALLPCAGFAIGLAMADHNFHFPGLQQSLIGSAPLAIAWIIAIAGPLLLAWFLRGRAAWMNALWAAWLALCCASPVTVIKRTTKRGFPNSRSRLLRK